MVLIYYYRWSCFSWHETTKSQPNGFVLCFFSFVVVAVVSNMYMMWKWLHTCGAHSEYKTEIGRERDQEINNENELFCSINFFVLQPDSIRFDSVWFSGLSLPCNISHATFGLHAIILRPTKKKEKRRRNHLMSWRKQQKLARSIYSISFIYDCH